MADTVLQTRRLSKLFGRVIAVDEVDLEVSRGEVFGFLGPNGAGKTTTIGLVLGLLHPTAGRIEIFGRPVAPARTSPLRQVGSLVGRPSLIPYLSGEDHLKLLSRFHRQVDRKRVGEVLDLVGMGGAAGRKAGTYSTGMKQRLGLAIALLARPELVILDEPTNGLDPAGMHEIRNLIRSLAAGGITVFLSSHLLHEVEQVCDRIAVIHRGRIVYQGAVGPRAGQGDQVVKVRVPSPGKAAEALASLPAVTEVSMNGTYIQVKGAPGETIISHLVSLGIVPSEVLVDKSDLESLFLNLTRGSR